MPLSPIATGAGPLREMFAFDKRIEVDDGAGNTEGEWQEQFRVAAGKAPMLGGETVKAGRLQGIQPYILTIRYDSRSALVAPDWRCRDLRAGKTYAIRSSVEWGRRYIDLVVVGGEAA